MVSNTTDMDLPVNVGGITFRNPFIVASGPTVKNIGMIREIERCGWGGASLKLSIAPAPYISIPPRYRWIKERKYHTFTAETRLEFEDGLRLVEQARKETSGLVIIANFAYAGGDGNDGWIDMARKYEAAGAHAVEMNLCCPNMSFNVITSGSGIKTLSGASIGSHPDIAAAAARAVREAVGIPVFVKLTPEGGRIAEVTEACMNAGMPLVTTTGNRLAIADYDIDNPARGIHRLQDEPTLACFSGPWLKPLALRDVYEMRKKCGPDMMIGGSGGINNWKDAVMFMQCGADILQVCTATMIHGFGILEGMVGRMKQWMGERGFSGYREFRDAVVAGIKPANDLTLHKGWARVDPGKCIGCGACEKIGHCYAISMHDNKARVNTGDCTGCSTCVDICPVDAIGIITADNDSDSDNDSDVEWVNIK